MIGSSDFSGYTRTFTKDGRGMTGAQHGMCELARYGAAGTPHGMCGLVFSLNSTVIVRMLDGRTVILTPLVPSLFQEQRQAVTAKGKLKTSINTTSQI